MPDGRYGWIIAVSYTHLLDDDGDDEIEIDEEEVVNYVIKNAQKDGVGKFEPEEITFIVQGELEYCDSINMFD